MVLTQFRTVPAGSTLEVHELDEHPGEIAPREETSILTDGDALAHWQLDRAVSGLPTLTDTGTIVGLTTNGSVVVLPLFPPPSNITGLHFRVQVYQGVILIEDEIQTILWDGETQDSVRTFVEGDATLTFHIDRSGNTVRVSVRGHDSLPIGGSARLSLQAETPIPSIAPPPAYAPSSRDFPLVQLTLPAGLQHDDPVPIADGLTVVGAELGLQPSGQSLVFTRAGVAEGVDVVVSETGALTGIKITGQIPTSGAVDLGNGTWLALIVRFRSGTLPNGTEVVDAVIISAWAAGPAGIELPQTTIQIFADDTYGEPAPDTARTGVAGQLTGQSGGIRNAFPTSDVRLGGTLHRVLESEGAWETLETGRFDLLTVDAGTRRFYRQENGLWNDGVPAPAGVVPTGVAGDDVRVLLLTATRLYEYVNDGWDVGTPLPAGVTATAGITIQQTPFPVTTFTAGRDIITARGRSI